MMSRRTFALGLSAVALLTLGSPAISQDARPKPPRRTLVVLVEDISGTTHRLVQARLFAESIGLLSVSLEPSDDYVLNIGKARVTVPVRDIHTIELSGGDKPGEWTTVTVTDHSQNRVTGKPDDPTKVEIRGQLESARFAHVEIKLNSVKKIIFTQTSHARACEKCRRHYDDADWKYCPHDGRRLPKLGK